MIKAVRQGWDVAMVAPILILIRALALGVGIAWGIGNQITGVTGLLLAVSGAALPVWRGPQNRKK